jgi:hypothetical protein
VSPIGILKPGFPERVRVVLAPCKVQIPAPVIVKLFSVIEGTAIINPVVAIRVTLSPPAGTPLLQLPAAVQSPPAPLVHVVGLAFEFIIMVTIKNMTSPILRKKERAGLEVRYKAVAFIPVFFIVLISAYSYFDWMKQ